jgi:putative FmdB family regulatory protein
MIDFDCPKCGKRVEVAEALADQPATCPHCGNVDVVPTAVAVSPVQRVQVTVSPVIPQGTVSGILGFVGLGFGVFACLGAWIPIIGCMSIPFALLGIVFGGLGLFVGRSGRAASAAAIIVASLALLMQIFWFNFFLTGATSSSQPTPTSATSTPK